MVSFTKAEKEFLAKNEACRLATCHDNIPHLVPVSYIFENDAFYFAADLETRKLANIMKNNKVALAVDVYSSVANMAVCVQGTVEVIERGPEFKRLYNIFSQKFEWVRRNPWKEGEAPFVRVAPTNKTSWGI